MGYDSWKAREPEDIEPRQHDWRGQTDQDTYCINCGRLLTEERIPLWCHKWNWQGEWLVQSIS